MFRWSLPLALCAAAFFSGCGLMQATRKFTSSMSQAASPNSSDSIHDDESQFGESAKQEMIMQQARSSSGMARSEEPDKWFSDLIHDERSKSIERSLGIEYY